MTNKTYFMRSFNLILYLFLFAPICSAFGWLFNYLSVQLTNITFVNLDTVKSITDIISSVCHGFALISPLLFEFVTNCGSLDKNVNPLGLWLALSKSQTAPFYILFYHDLLG